MLQGIETWDIDNLERMVVVHGIWIGYLLRADGKLLESMVVVLDEE